MKSIFSRTSDIIKPRPKAVSRNIKTVSRYNNTYHYLVGKCKNRSSTRVSHQVFTLGLHLIKVFMSLCIKRKK